MGVLIRRRWDALDLSRIASTLLGAHDHYDAPSIPCTVHMLHVQVRSFPFLANFRPPQDLNNRTISFLSPADLYNYHTTYSRASRATFIDTLLHMHSHHSD